MIKGKHGELMQIQPGGDLEGGDSANWTGHYIYLTGSDLNFRKIFEVYPGAYVRHPDKESTFNGFGAHYEGPYHGCISRDQLTGIIAALIAQKDYSAMGMLMGHHACTMFLFAYNNIKNGRDPKTAKWKMPDLTLFDIWACELRGFGWFSWVFWPVLCVLDIHVLIGVIVERFQKDPDVISLLMKYFISRDYVPTPTSWLASKVIGKEDLKKKVTTYWSGWRRQPEMAELYVKRL